MGSHDKAKDAARGAMTFAYGKPTWQERAAKYQKTENE
jgi:hypothetical protein